jgi:hypothetical protein
MTFTLASPTIGAVDITTVTTIAPGTSNLPGLVYENQLGQLVEGWDPTYGNAQFIYLKVPVSTTVTAGLLYQWDRNYQITVVPARSTSKNTGVPVALALNSVSSNSSSVQYTWFLIRGQYTALKTAAAAAPASAIYISTTAGRINFTSSAGAQILGGRTMNTATVTSTTSTVAIYLNLSAIEGA